MYVRQVRHAPTYYRSKCYVLNVLNLGFIALTLLLSLTGVVPRKADHDGVRVGLVDHAGELLLALCQGRHLRTAAPTDIIGTSTKTRQKHSTAQHTNRARDESMQMNQGKMELLMDGIFLGVGST